MLAVAKKIGLLIAAVVVGLVLYLVATVPHHELEEEEPVGAAPAHASRHGGSVTPVRTATDESLIVTVARMDDGIQLSLGSAGQSSVCSLPEIVSVLGNYSSEGSSVEVYLEVGGEVKFSDLKEVVDTIMSVPKVRVRLMEKYVIGAAK